MTVFQKRPPDAGSYWDRLPEKVREATNKPKGRDILHESLVRV